MSFATVAALSALLFSAIGLIGDAPPAVAAGTAASSTAASRTAASSTAASSTATTASASPAPLAPSTSDPADTAPPSSTPSPPPTPEPVVLDPLPSGVVTVFDVIDEQGLPVIVMELVDGPSLGDVLAERGTIDPREAAAIGAKLTDSLDAAHRAGVLHRDV